jgi:hypothetical protein
MTIEAIDHFLRRAVFYPCSGLDGAPVKFLGKRFQRFIYADYHIERETFERKCMEQGFLGYHCRLIEELDVGAFFGCSWRDIYRANQKVFDHLYLEWVNPFLALAEFERITDYSDDHGPERFDLIFARCEAITTSASVFSRRGIAPSCVAYICSGIGCGGNFPRFPQELERVLRINPGGLPKFLLYDGLAANPRSGDYLRLIEDYTPLKRWDYRKEVGDMANVTLTQLKIAADHQRPPSDFRLKFRYGSG